MKTTTHFEELRQIKLSQFESLFLHNLHKSDDNIMIVPTPDEVEQKSTGNWYSNMVMQSDLESKTISKIVQTGNSNAFPSSQHNPLFVQS